MDFSRARVEALESFLAWLVELVIDYNLFGPPSLLVDGLLAVDEIDGEAFGVFDADDVATTRGIFHFFNAGGKDFHVWDLGDSGALLELMQEAKEKGKYFSSSSMLSTSKVPPRYFLGPC